MRYLMTHSLLSAWLYALKGNPYEDATTERDPWDDFMRVLRREPTETTPAMQDGIDFEALVTAVINGIENEKMQWYEAVKRVAERLRGGVLQYKAYKDITVGGMPILLYGRLDCLKAGEIIDVKFTKSYDPGKYYGSTQHPTYLELVPEARDFTYIASNGTGVWEETYRREETRSIIPIAENFLDWLSDQRLMPVYREKWGAK